MSGEVVAVIPARGGSKGVPGKNLRRVGGVPLVARAIASAREAARVDRVVVSTDDAEIATVAREWGAEVVDRPVELSGDTASSESALLHALDTLQARGVSTRVVVFLQATSPFIDAVDLDDAVGRVLEGPESSVFSAVESWGFLWRHGEEGMRGVNHDPSRRPRRQDREPEYLETGAFYVMDAEGFRAARHRFFGRTGVALVAERGAIEVDTPEQLTIASAIAASQEMRRPMNGTMSIGSCGPLAIGRKPRTRKKIRPSRKKTSRPIGRMSASSAIGAITRTMTRAMSPGMSWLPFLRRSHPMSRYRCPADGHSQAGAWRPAHPP